MYITEKRLRRCFTISNIESDKSDFKVYLRKIGNSTGIIIPAKIKLENITGFFCTIQENKEIHMIPSKYLIVETIIDKSNFPFYCKVTYNPEFSGEKIELYRNKNKIEHLISGEKIRSFYDIALYIAQYLILDNYNDYKDFQNKIAYQVIKNNNFEEFCKILNLNEKEILHEAEQALSGYIQNEGNPLSKFYELKELIKDWKNLRETKSVIRMVTSKNAYQELLDVEKFLSANVNDYIIWGYARKRKKESPCDFIAVFNEGNPEKKFYGLLKVDGIIHNDDPDFDRDEWKNLFRETGLLNWLDDPDIYSSFYKIIDYLIFPPNSNIGHMDNFRNDKGESLLTPGKIRTGNFIKYVGNEPDILDFLSGK